MFNFRFPIIPDTKGMKNSEIAIATTIGILIQQNPKFLKILRKELYTGNDMTDAICNATLKVYKIDIGDIAIIDTPKKLLDKLPI